MTKATSPKPIRAAIYTRKSTTAGLEQDFNSIDAQREACETYAKQQDWQVVPFRYDDGGFSGANTSRPAFQRLLADVKAKRIDVVVVYKIDRLSRSLLDFVSLLDTFNKANTAFVSVTQHFSTADAMGRLTLNILATFAQFEREMIAERTRDKVGAARRKGKWTGGAVTIGYDVVDKKLVVHPAEAAIVREAFRHYLDTGSALAVMHHLNAAGHLTKQHVSALGKVREAHTWDKGDVLRVLKNPLYAGFIQSRGALHKGEHQPLVGKDDFDRVQAMLATKCTVMRDDDDTPAIVTRNPEYLLAGLLWCPNCNHAYTTATTSKGGRTYRYYRAVSQLKRGHGHCTCGHIPAPAIEGYVFRRIREACQNGNLAEEVAARAKEKLASRRAGLVKETRELTKAVADLETEGKRMEKRIASTRGVRRGALQDELAALIDRHGPLQARLAAIPREQAALDAAQVNAEWVAKAIANFESIWEVLIPLNRLRLVQALVRRVTYDVQTKRIRVEMRTLGVEEGEPAEPQLEEAAA